MECMDNCHYLSLNESHACPKLISQIRMLAGLSYGDCCTATPWKALLIGHGLGGRPLQVLVLHYVWVYSLSNLAFCQDGPPHWLDLQQIQLHSTLAYPPCQVVFAILLIPNLICACYPYWPLYLGNCKHQKNVFFRFRKLDIPVCSSNVSALANQLYLKNQVRAKKLYHSFVSE